ncbi:MAG: hypothetical protein ABIG66_03045 [Candidatus Kerfeldbacteria bacterium]
MSDSQFDFSELFIAKDDGRSTIRLFSSNPTPLEEKNLGRLFAVLEIDSTDSINDDILDVIMDEVNTHYYQAESFEVETAFEYALQKTNQRLQDLIGEIGDEWLGSLNVLIGVQKNKQLVFANVGRVIAIMLHNDSIVDILDTTRAKAQEINPVKIFGNIVSGDLSDSSILVFATETILDYLSKEKIKRILTENTIEPALEQFYGLLEEDTANTNFAAFVIQRKKMLAESGASAASRIETDDIPVVNRPGGDDIGHRDSMTTLVQQQSQTEELLSSSLWPNIKKSISEVRQSLKKKRSSAPAAAGDAPINEDQSAPVQSVLKTRKSSTSSATTILQKIWRSVLKGFALLGSGIKSIGGGVISLFNRKKPDAERGTKRSFSVGSRPAVSRTAGGLISRMINWFKSLSLLQKAFFVIAIIVLLLFAQSVINRGEENISKEQEQEYASVISDVDVKVNEAKAALIYDRDNARTLFFEARDLLSGIPQSSDIYKERGEELARIINDQLKELNNIITLEGLSPVLDYASISPDVSLSHIVLLGASMYAFDRSNASVYRGNLENQGTTVTISDLEGGKQFNAVAKSSPGTGIAAYTDNTFTVFNPVGESLTPLDLQYGDADHAFTDLFIFGVRLYALDTQNSQIYRHRKEGEDFSAPEAWLEDGSINLSDAVSLAIDGEIYILKSNGSVERLSLGASDPSFTLSAVDPALNSGTEIYTDENSSNLYILDTVNSRVVVFDKEGNLVAQYTSPSFNNLIDFVVDEPNGAIYILNGTQLYEIQLQEGTVSGLENEPAPVVAEV